MADDKNNPIINLRDHPDFVLNPGLNDSILYHGKAVNITKISMVKAEQMAREKGTGYVQFSPARIARDATAAAAAATTPPATVKK